TDTYLTDMYATAEFDLSKITVDRGIFLSDEEVRALGKYRYMRHKLTPSGVSPRVIPGQADALVVTDSDEHTEDGHITESAEVRIQMVHKRLKKMNGLRAEIGIPHTYGPKEAETVLACWGSTYGALREAVDRLNNAGAGVRMIQMSGIWPFPRKAFMDAIKGSRRLIVVEGNAMGQMAHLIRAETGVDTMGKILRFDGRPLTPAYIVTRFQEAMA
ncbi:MAG: 2-oxoacid:acceptor oxidoreductase subunit alpha, partial [Candidatus Bathyarchaeia archaeon]